MGWKVKVDWSQTELNYCSAWVKNIIYDSIEFTVDEDLAFEFTDARQFGDQLHLLKFHHPKLKWHCKPVLRLVPRARP